MEYCLWL